MAVMEDFVHLFAGDSEAGCASCKEVTEYLVVDFRWEGEERRGELVPRLIVGMDGLVWLESWARRDEFSVSSSEAAALVQWGESEDEVSESCLACCY